LYIGSLSSRSSLSATFDCTKTRDSLQTTPRTCETTMNGCAVAQVDERFFTQAWPMSPGLNVPRVSAFMPIFARRFFFTRTRAVT
jgi:hypothetical protein